ncbi:MAG: hypothetical protein EOO89_01525 [Pedobacter sp.]|nr:MAG: hypothetical protein EOO89_01525 [Pedobacter sp.]
MIINNKEGSVNGILIVVLLLLNAIAIRNGFVDNTAWYWVSAFTIPILAFVLWRTRQATRPSQKNIRKHIIQREKNKRTELTLDHH